MSHEIRTPMNAVLGLAYLLDKPGISQDIRDIGQKISRAGQSLQSIINDILDFSKIESGKVVLANEAFYLKDIIDNVSTIMSAYAHNKNIELIIKCDAPREMKLLGDSLRLEQILINLVGNAIKFTLQGHVALTVALRNHTDTNACLRCTVEDTGIGMDKDTLQRIFHMFEQAETTTMKRFGGTGLGLTISTRLLDMMGSTLHAHSEVGRGTTFYFDLTLPQLPTEQTTLSTIHNLKVLIADDHEIVLDSLQLSAEALKWQTICVHNGQQALECAIKNTPIDLYVLDWKMPVLDGLAAARAIKTHAGENNAPPPVIIMVTAYSRDSVLNAPEASYVDAVLEKPVTPSNLYNAAIAILDKHNATPTPHAMQHALKGIRLLVVDDNEFNRDVAERIFTAEGATVFSVSDGEKALEWLHKNSGDVDAVLMDIQMPVMDGYEATRAIRNIPQLQNLPVIALTAGAFNVQREAAFEAGMNAFIAKPFDVPKAIAIILNALEKKPQLAQIEAPARDEHKNPKPYNADTLFDFAHALSLWGDHSTIYRYLDKFLHDYSAVWDDFLKLSPEDIAKKAHKLRGAAAALCLNKLAKAAQEVEHQCMINGDILTALDFLYDCLQQTFTEIQKLLAESPPESMVQHTPHIEQRPLQAIIQDLNSTLEQDNPNTIRPLLSELSTIVGTASLKDLKDAVDNYDFDEARKLLQKLLHKQKIELE
jgi:CheY-like chemotaxis protein